MPDAWQLINGGEVSQQQLKVVAKDLLKAAGEQKLWFFHGEMGSGKTTLIKSIGEVLGVNEIMSSPTFSIINEYEGADGNKIYHFDLYRIKDEKELMEIGANEYFDSGQWCLIEWPEKLGTMTPSSHFDIRITTTGVHHRKIEYQRT
ncbi:MAG: tRNA (adenosine(37)-N6)-threonylcarbamoyltransferase complex ATPase subunit type 1 TsaE [Cyclobacteriaceae bacterium]|nr:tRNA (adenosine(37)-N6)-threonylcarbamoyltransferase complex ATPase subunit type 1 TsaE [Cyclobacteriaceae bacterium]